MSKTLPAVPWHIFIVLLGAYVEPSIRTVMLVLLSNSNVFATCG